MHAVAVATNFARSDLYSLAMISSSGSSAFGDKSNSSNDCKTEHMNSLSEVMIVTLSYRDGRFPEFSLQHGHANDALLIHIGMVYFCCKGDGWCCEGKIGRYLNIESKRAAFNEIK